LHARRTLALCMVLAVAGLLSACGSDAGHSQMQALDQAFANRDQAALDALLDFTFDDDELQDTPTERADYFPQAIAMLRLATDVPHGFSIRALSDTAGELAYTLGDTQYTAPAVRSGTNGTWHLQVRLELRGAPDGWHIADPDAEQSSARLLPGIYPIVAATSGQTMLVPSERETVVTARGMETDGIKPTTYTLTDKIDTAAVEADLRKDLQACFGTWEGNDCNWPDSVAPALGSETVINDRVSDITFDDLTTDNPGKGPGYVADQTSGGFTTRPITFTRTHILGPLLDNPKTVTKMTVTFHGSWRLGADRYGVGGISTADVTSQ